VQGHAGAEESIEAGTLKQISRGSGADPGGAKACGTASLTTSLNVHLSKYIIMSQIGESAISTGVIIAIHATVIAAHRTVIMKAPKQLG